MSPFVSSGLALFAGAAFGLIFGNPWPEKTRRWTSIFLGIAIVALGARTDLHLVMRAGTRGVLYTATSILLTLVFGRQLGRLLRASPPISALLTVGTAICGGSAIAAIAPIIRAKDHEVALALATVFLLNAVALFIFPPIGHWFHLSQSQFGEWAALAIHDTSSVVGATLQYGREALEIGTTLKLTRALWIVPVALLFSAFYQSGKKPSPRQLLGRSWFILGFLLASTAVSLFPSLRPLGSLLAQGGSRLLVLTLFLIGSGLSISTLKNVGLRPLIQATVLWVVVASATLIAITLHWIQA